MNDLEIVRRIVFDEATDDEREYYVDNLMSEFEKSIGKPFWEFTKDDEIDREVFEFNKAKGELGYMDCPRCNNKGFYAVNQDGHMVTLDCPCVQTRKTLRQLEKSGLGNMLEICTFDNFDCDSDWQKSIYNKAKAFVNSKTNWFYIGGQSGTGKTHLCTAITKELILQGRSAKYMLWLDESVKLKQCKANKPDEYERLIEEIKNVEVLYIDDFLKVGKNQEPTTADINLAMEILNYRYNIARESKNCKYITIISSERRIDEILDYDEATGSRIVEMTRPDYLIFVGGGDDKNYRLKEIKN